MATNLLTGETIQNPQTLTLTPPTPTQNVAPQAPSGTTPTGLDPKIVNLAQAIRQTESGGNFAAQGKSGEYGAYQFMPGTWAASSTKYGVDVPIEQATPAQQNEVAYKQLADWAQEHPDWNVGNFASAWNAGPGAPDAYLQNNVGTNSKGVAYDTPGYAQKVALAYQNFKAQNASQTPQDAPGGPQTPAAEEAPSLGGFAGNVLTSGANFLGNTADALLHPINTIQNIGGAAAGGLQELGGQQNENTQKFDNLVGYFKDRYGGVDNLEKTIYTDPVGFLADFSAVLGVGAGVAGAVGKVGELSTAADAARAGDLAASTGLRTMAGDTASGNALTRGAATAQSALGTASKYTNPIALPAMGVGAVAGKLAKPVASLLTNISQKGIGVIAENPEEFTASKIASASREDLGAEVGQALQNKIDELSDTGKGYESYRTTPIQIQVEPDFLDNALREHAGVDVTDGVIKGSSSSSIRDVADIKELQDIYNRYKPDFLAGTMDSNKFLNLRDDLSKTANFNKGLSKDIQFAARDVRENLNSKYRNQVGGLEEKDTEYATRKGELDTLRKGLIDKNGNLLKTTTNKIANAGGVGKGDLLKQLEEVIPGITKRIEIQKVMEEIDKAANLKGGAYVKTIGEVAVGMHSLPLAAGALATAILTHPNIAVPLIRAIGGNQALLAMVMYKLAQAANLPTTLNRATNTQAQESQPDTELIGQTDLSTDHNQSQQEQPTSQSQQFSSDLNSLATNKGFDLEKARAAGYSDKEIQDFLSTQQ